MKKTVLAVDIGTSSLKAGIIDSDGKLLFWKREAYDESYDQTDGKAEIWHTDIWVRVFKKIINNLPEISIIDSIVFSGSGPTLIPFDSSGSYQSESLLWYDRKKIDIPDKESFFLPKAAWFMKNRPDKYEKTQYLVPLSGFFPYLLTGKPCSPLPGSSFIPYYWQKSSITGAGLDPDKFPEFCFAGDFIGEVTEKASAEYRIKAGVPVFSGAGDYLMALLGTGSTYPGAVCDRAGTSEGINYCSEKKITCENLRTLPHIVPGCYNVSGLLTSSGMIFEWFKKISGQEKKPYIELLKEISGIIQNEDTLYFFPSLKKGSVWKFSGGAFVGLEPGHGVLDTGSAVVKSIGFSVRDVIETMEACSLTVEEIRLSGGQARNPAWNQMKSDITGKKIIVPEIYDGELVGCACSGFKGLGIFNNLLSASEKLVKIKEVYTPDPAAYKKYTVLYEKYSMMSSKITSLVGELLGN